MPYLVSKGCCPVFLKYGLIIFKWYLKPQYIHIGHYAVEKEHYQELNNDLFWIHGCFFILYILAISALPIELFFIIELLNFIKLQWTNGDKNRKLRLSNRSNSIETNQTDWSNGSNSSNWLIGRWNWLIGQSNPIEHLQYVFFWWLVSIDFDWFDRSAWSSSIDFDHSVRLICLISSIDSIDQFNWVWLT